MSALLGVYRIIAVIPSGVTLCTGFLLICRVELLDFLGKAPMVFGNAITIADLSNWAGFGLLVIAAFIAGELVQAVGRICERIWWAPFGDWPSVKLLRQVWTPAPQHRQHGIGACLRRHVYSDQLTGLLPDQRVRLNRLIEQKIGVPRLAAGQPRLDGKQIMAIQREMFVQVNAAGRDERVFVFNQNYGFYSGLLMAFLVLAIFAWWHGGEAMLGWVFFASSVICIAGVWTTAYDYGGEIVLQFLNLPETGAEQPAPAEAARVAIVVENKTVEIIR